MDFGQRNPFPGMDFSLAPHLDYRRPKGFSSNLQTTQRPPTKIYFGCPQWNHPDWKIKVYPEGSPEKDHLLHYSRMFNAVEMNATFYKIPDVSAVEKWASQTPLDFKFVTKIPKQISHELTFGNHVSTLRAFIEAVENFGDRLGLLFLQLPPHFSYAEKAHLISFCRSFPKKTPWAVEFRHESWFENRQPLEKMCEWFSSEGISLVITDTLGRRDVSHGAITSGKVMVRFLGSELDPMDWARIEDWVERIRLWVESGVEEIYFFGHQRGESTCPDLLMGAAKNLRAVFSGARASEILFRLNPPPVAVQLSQMPLF